MISHEQTIIELKNQYKDPIFYDKDVTLQANYIIDNGFKGSYNTIVFTSKDTMTFEAPGCLAAPMITMVARNAINLGTSMQRNELFPLRIYAPLYLSIIADHITLGDLDLETIPKLAIIYCRKLSFLCVEAQEIPVYEKVKNWKISTNKIEMIFINSKKKQTFKIQKR